MPRGGERFTPTHFVLQSDTKGCTQKIGCQGRGEVPEKERIHCTAKVYWIAVVGGIWAVIDDDRPHVVIHLFFLG